MEKLLKLWTDMQPGTKQTVIKYVAGGGVLCFISLVVAAALTGYMTELFTLLGGGK